MKRTAVALIVVFLAVTLSFQVNLQVATAQSSNYTIDQVDHHVQVLSSGHVVVTDKIHTSGQLPSSLQIGFPFKYGSHLLKATAYDSNNKLLPVTLGVQMQNQGFYAASIDLSAQTTSDFTIVFTFNNDLIVPFAANILYTLDFPAYPSLTQTTGICNVTLQPPISGGNVKIYKPDGLINSTRFSTNNLAAFTNAPATANFTVTPGYFHQITISSLESNLFVDSTGATSCTQTYTMTSNSDSSVNSILIDLPIEATNVAVKDQTGRTLHTFSQQTTSNSKIQNVTLNVPLNKNDLGIITLDYTLPNITPQQSSFTLDLNPYPYLNYYVNSESITLTPPEGAKITAPTLNQLDPTTTLSRDIYQQTLSIHKDGISRADVPLASENNVSVSFDYSALWIAFRPTSWVWAIAFIGVFGVALYKRPKTKTQKTTTTHTAPSTPKTPTHVKSDDIEEIANAYEEKSNLLDQQNALDAKVQKGKISRRRYKVQTKNNELRLNSLNQRIEKLSQNLRDTGEKHADIIKQMENADAQLNEVNLALKSLETRRQIGEITVETYRSQLSELERRKEKAQDNFDGVLSRLH